MVCHEVDSQSLIRIASVPSRHHPFRPVILSVILSPRLLSSLSPPTLSPVLCTSTPIVTMGLYTALWTTPSPSSMSASWRREHSQKTRSLTRRFSFAGKVVWGRRAEAVDPKGYIEDLEGGGLILFSLHLLLVPVVMDSLNWTSKY